MCDHSSIEHDFIIPLDPQTVRLIHSPALGVEEPLPPPRQELQIDITCGDAELFERYFCPSGAPKIQFLGDLWQDVPWIW